ncbi:MAG: glycoside hydrolase family 2 [Gemmatimonadaceae bacterium]
MSELPPSQRRLMVVIALATLATLTIVSVDLAVGSRPDPPEQRATATLLNGSWRFHTGDDPRWADASTDDSDWETIDLTAAPGSHDGDVGLPDYVGGWMAHGHPGYTGYAWYRRAVDVPAGAASWDILGPTLVEDGYEIYWNGRLLGGSGRLGAHPRVVGTRPLRFALPAAAAGSRGVLAVRAFMIPRSASSADGGGMHTPPTLAPRPVSDALQHAHWQRTIAGYVVDAVEPLAMCAVIVLMVWGWSRSSQKGFLVFASIALALTAARRLNNAIGAWTDLLDLPTYSWLAKVMWIPALAAWTMAWNRWGARPRRSIDVLAAGLAVAQLFGAFTPAPLVMSLSRLASITLLVVVGARIVRSGPMRTLALVTMVSIVAVTFGGEVLDPIGIPGIWFPFGIGVSRSQYLYAIVIPLVACLAVRTFSSTDRGSLPR